MFNLMRNNNQTKNIIIAIFNLYDFFLFFCVSQNPFNFFVFVKNKMKKVLMMSIELK